MKVATAIIKMTRSRWAFLLLFTIFSSALSLAFPPAQVSAALSADEQRQCYSKFNNQDVTYSSLSIADQSLYNKCRSEGICFDAGEGTAIGSRKISCTNPSNPDVLQQATSNAAAAEISPLLKLVCGSMPTSDTLFDSYIKCTANVRSIYADCDNSGGSITSEVQDTNQNTAKCVRDRLSNPKPTIQEVLAAVTSGRNAAEGIVNASIDAISLEQKKADCEAAGKVWTNNTCQERTSPADACRIDGIGWIVCPLISFLTKITDGAYEAAEELLIFTIPEPFSTDPLKNPIYALWSSIRNIANIVFVLAFFAVIFSQATSMGISAYGIRKMLPRIVAAAILVNLSYYICVLAIDISNIIGGGLDDLIRALPSSALTEPENGAWEKIGSSILGFTLVGATAVGVAYLATGTFFALLAFSFLAIITAVAIFMARHALIIMLIILSPLAFVAYILPNTENLFDKWRKAFTAMLVMYPLVAVLFAGSQVASSIMLATAGGDSDGGTGGDFAWLYKIAALAVLAIPLFGVPWIVKFSGGFIGRVAGMVNDRSKGLVDRARNAGNKGAEVRRGELRTKMAGNKFGSRLGYERNADGTLKKDANGNLIEKSGRFGRVQRRMGGAGQSLGGLASYAARYSGDKAFEYEKRKSEIARSDEEDLRDRLREVDANGRPTARAASLARRAAGVGGEEGIQRIQRAVNEKHRKEFVDDVGRKNADWSADGAYDSGAMYTELEYNQTTKRWEYARDSQNRIKFHQDHGKAMAAVAKGLDVGYVKAGQEATEENIRTQIMKGSDGAIAQNAAMKHIADIGDAAAIDHALYGPNQLSDSQVSDFMQWIAGNPGAVGSKLSHILTKDQGLTGVNGAKMAAWHGTEFKVAASRARQLRESGDVAGAKKIEDAVRLAYENLATDPNLAQDFNQKHVDAMKQFNAIVSGTTNRYRLREYGDSERTDVSTGGYAGAVVDIDPNGEASRRGFDIT